MNKIPVLITPTHTADTYIDKACPRLLIWAYDIVSCQDFHNDDGEIFTQLKYNEAGKIMTMVINETASELHTMIFATNTSMD